MKLYESHLSGWKFDVNSVFYFKTVSKSKHKSNSGHTLLKETKYLGWLETLTKKNWSIENNQVQHLSALLRTLQRNCFHTYSQDCNKKEYWVFVQACSSEMVREKYEERKQVNQKNFLTHILFNSSQALSRFIFLSHKKNEITNFFYKMILPFWNVLFFLIIRFFMLTNLHCFFFLSCFVKLFYFHSISTIFSMFLASALLISFCLLTFVNDKVQLYDKNTVLSIILDLNICFELQIFCNKKSKV